MKSIFLCKTGTVLVLAALATSAWAAQGDARSVSSTSGGVSLNSRDQLRSNTPDHNVKMVFSLTTGNYLSDVAVKVVDGSRRTVIDEVSNGPWLFAKLPPGNYKVTATFNDKAVTHGLSVGKTGVRTVQFRWPPSVEQSGASTADGEAGGRLLGTGPQERR